MNKHILSFIAGAAVTSVVFISLANRRTRVIERVKQEFEKDTEALLEACGVVYEKAVNGDYRGNPEAARSDIRFFTIAYRNK
jgi:hypothetical protein